jgi:glycosyltransferase involved in cell wall biosynthesis
MLFSIIIPTYNSANTLKRCLDSIVNQNFNSFEVLIIDGLSTDLTMTIVESYNEDRFRIISELDKGIYDAMNKGIGLAKGEWIYFFGSDDFFHDSLVLQKVTEFISDSNVEVLYGNVISDKFQGRYDGIFDEYKILDKNICHQSIFYKRSVFEKLGVYNLKYKVCADWDFNMQWLLSPLITNLYADIIVADYADNGFSSKEYDTFENEKTILYLVYGRKILPLKIKVGLLKDEIKRSYKEGNQRLLLSLLLEIPKIISGV